MNLGDNKPKPEYAAQEVKTTVVIMTSTGWHSILNTFLVTGPRWHPPLKVGRLDGLWLGWKYFEGKIVFFYTLFFNEQLDVFQVVNQSCPSFYACWFGWRTAQMATVRFGPVIISCASSCAFEDMFWSSWWCGIVLFRNIFRPNSFKITSFESPWVCNRGDR